jgi:hypothetical protein
MKSFFVSVLLALGILVPALAFAQTPGTGVLDVYVQVINTSCNDTYQYQYNSCPVNVLPNSFTVNVSGQSPSITNFQGSTSGTLVSLNSGSYNVSVSNNNQYGFTPSYSTGCNSTIAGGQSQTCVITESMSQGPYNGYYPYPPYNGYTPPSLTCAPAYQTVNAGQTAQFTAEGGAGGTYNWQTPEQNYPNVGPVLSVVFANTGSQLVTVTDANQTATCSINVVAANGYYPVSTYYPTTPSYTVVPSTPNYVSSYTSGYTAYPTWPNTGFAPYGGSAGALAIVALAAIALIAAPYVRKAFIAVAK